jgi:hypothetical protein
MSVRQARISQRRVIIFRVLAGLAGAFFLFTLPQAISPWGAVTLSNMDGVTDPNLHRWSAALAGGPDLGMAGLLLYLAWRPLTAPLALQWIALGAIVFLVVNVPFVGLYVAVIAVPVILVLVAYPQPRELLTRPWADGVRVPVLVLGTVAAVLLLSDAGRSLAAQLRGADELAANFDWASNAEHVVSVALAAVLAGMRRPGAHALGVMAAAVLVFMGAAAISVPADPGSWGLIGGAVAIGIGVVLLAATVSLQRRAEVTLAARSGARF